MSGVKRPAAPRTDAPLVRVSSVAFHFDLLGCSNRAKSVWSCPLSSACCLAVVEFSSSFLPSDVVVAARGVVVSFVALQVLRSSVFTQVIGQFGGKVRRVGAA